MTKPKSHTGRPRVMNIDIWAEVRFIVYSECRRQFCETFKYIRVLGGKILVPTIAFLKIGLLIIWSEFEKLVNRRNFQCLSCIHTDTCIFLYANTLIYICIWVYTQTFIWEVNKILYRFNRKIYTRLSTNTRK